MALPVLNQGKTLTTDNLYDFATREIFPFNEQLLDLAGAIVALAEAVEQGGGVDIDGVSITKNAQGKLQAVQVNGHTVNSDVPANAKFTDTTYSAATTSALGLTKPDGDLVKVDSAGKITTDEGLYLTCSTSAGTSAKTVTCTGYTLKKGRPICVCFSNGNTASAPTLNINSTGAKSIYSNGTSSDAFKWDSNERVFMVYDGSRYRVISTSSESAKYGTCTTAEATTAKVATSYGYYLKEGGFVSIKFTYAVPAGATLNVNSRGAKTIYYGGSVITAGVITAGDIALFMYDGTYYQLLCVNRASGGGDSTRAMTDEEIDDIWDSVFGT